MSKIFISYRRSDTKGVAGRIYERLKSTFGSDDVFLDTEGIGIGPFPKQIEDALKGAKVFLILIGDQWATIPDADSGLPRLNNPDDWVRKEVETALQRYRLARNKKDRVVIIPMLVDGALMPQKSALPHSLQALIDFNAFPVRSVAGFSPDTDRLIAEIKKVLRPARPWWFLALLATVAALVLGLALLFSGDPPLICNFIDCPPTPTVTANGATQTPQVTSAAAPQTETVTPFSCQPSGNTVCVEILIRSDRLTILIEKDRNANLDLSDWVFIDPDEQTALGNIFEIYTTQDWNVIGQGKELVCLAIVADQPESILSNDCIQANPTRVTVSPDDAFWYDPVRTTGVRFSVGSQPCGQIVAKDQLASCTFPYDMP